MRILTWSLVVTTLCLITSSSSAFLAPRLPSRTLAADACSIPLSAQKLPILAEDTIMNEKAHGTSPAPVQKNLRWNCDYETADRICNFNRHYAEYAGYWTTTSFLNYTKSLDANERIEFYDSVTANLLFVAPVGRSMQEFLLESSKHGWPSFRDDEVNWEFVRCLGNGECVSTTGTHLGHNLPDATGNRYCINLVSVAAQPPPQQALDEDE